ncbi:hypothetical protein D9M71_160310 [compost metagenome]
MRALPGSWQCSPSGQRPPLVIVPIRPMARVVLPLPPAPARRVNLPRATQPGHNQRIGIGMMEEAGANSARQLGDTGCFMIATGSALIGSPPVGQVVEVREVERRAGRPVGEGHQAVDRDRCPHRSAAPRIALALG